MPNADEILHNLERTAYEMQWLAAVWHVVLLASVVAFLAGWKPTVRSAALALTTPAISVSVVAWLYGNPFNGSVFGVLALALVYLAIGFSDGRVRVAPVGARIAGGAMLAYGWAYPHFLADADVLRHLCCAPFGLIPCPSLAVMIGFTLLADGLHGRAWSIWLAATGTFYGVFGVLRLGVWVDIGLLLGSILVLLRSLRRGPGPVLRSAGV